MFAAFAANLTSVGRYSSTKSINCMTGTPSLFVLVILVAILINPYLPIPSRLGRIGVLLLAKR
jgi:hypothetical protein